MDRYSSYNSSTIAQQQIRLALNKGYFREYVRERCTLDDKLMSKNYDEKKHAYILDIRMWKKFERKDKQDPSETFPGDAQLAPREGVKVPATAENEWQLVDRRVEQTRDSTQDGIAEGDPKFEGIEDAEGKLI